MSILNKTFLVFIAHPDDVSQEITVVKDACKIITEQQRENQIIVEARDFQDLSPSRCSPQKYINTELVKKCDIFIGLINKSIGNKGFSEELNLGLKCSEKNNIHFCLYIKQGKLTATEKTNRDKFLKPLEDRILFMNFSKISTLRDLLIIHIGRIINSYLATKPIESIQPKEVSNIKLGPQKKSRKIEPKKQKGQPLLGPNESVVLEQIYNKTAKLLTKKVKFNDFERIRLFLHASALLYDKRIPTEILGNHEIQLLYLFKEKVKPSANENKLILRTLIADQYNHKTGWYWLKHIRKTYMIIYFCLNLLRHDISEDVRIGALKILDKFWYKELYAFLDGLESDQSENVRIKAIEMLKNHPSRKSLELLQKYKNDSSEEIKKKVKEFTFGILSKIDVHQAISMIINKEEINYYSIEDELYNKAFDTELKKLLQHENESVCSDAMEALLRRNSLTIKELYELSKNSNWDIRYLALDGLINKGENITPTMINTILKDQGDPVIRRLIFFSRQHEEKNLLLKVYRNLNMEHLEQLLDWGYQGSYIYELLMTKYFKQNVNQLIIDLEDNFNIKKQSLLNKMAILEHTTIQVMEKAFEKYNDFIRRSFIQVALKVLLKHKDKRAVKFAYRLVNEDDSSLQGLCYDIIANFGDEKDSTFLFETAKRLNNYQSKQIVVNAMYLDRKRKYNIIEKSLGSENKDITCAALAYCLAKKIKINEEKVISMLHLKDDNVRKHAVVYLIANNSRYKLSRIQKNYYESQTYFYNVVSYLDIFLYAPRKYKQIFFNELKNQIIKNIK